MSDPRMLSKETRVVCAAIKLRNGKIICGVRHFDSIMHQQLPKSQWLAKWQTRNCVQGFVDSKRNFLTRDAAYLVAFDAKQIRNPVENWGRLYSEDLY